MRSKHMKGSITGQNGKQQLQEKGRNHMKLHQRAGMLAVILALGLTSAGARASVMVTAVGVDTTTQAGWRTTTVVKPFAINNGGVGLQNVYGKDGYLTMATTLADYSGDHAVNGLSAAEAITGNAATTAAGMSALSSLPSWVTIAAVGTGWNWYNNWNAMLFDDPTLPPGTSVADLSAGNSYKSAGDGDFFTLTFGANAPGKIRIGFVDIWHPISMTLSGASSTATQVEGDAGALRYVFFDVQDAAGQTLTLSLDVSSQNNYGMSAFTFDVIPEPSSVALLGLGGLLLWRRRSRQSVRA